MVRLTGAASAPPSGCKPSSPSLDKPRKRAGRARARSAAEVQQPPMDAAAATGADAGTCMTAEDGTFDEDAWAAAAVAAGCFYSGVAHDASVEAGASPVLCPSNFYASGWTAEGCSGDQLPQTVLGGDGSVEDPYGFPGFASFFGAMPALFCDASDMPMLPLGMSPDGMVCELDPEDQLDAFYRALIEDKNVVCSAFLEALSLVEEPVQGGPGEEPVASDNEICTALLDALTEQMSVCSKRRHRLECESLPEEECVDLGAIDVVEECLLGCCVEESEADPPDDSSAQRTPDHDSGGCAQEVQEEEPVAQEQSAQHMQQDSGRSSRHEGYTVEEQKDESSKWNRPEHLHTHTTAMLRNIPNKYTREMLVQQLNYKFRGQFNFLYLPIDFKNKCNVGYAFINFRSVEAYRRFIDTFDGISVCECLPGLNSRKIVEVTPARVHGLTENVSRLRDSPVMHELLQHPEWMPLLFNEDGSVKPFPASDLPTAAKMKIHRRQVGCDTAKDTPHGVGCKKMEKRDQQPTSSIWQKKGNRRSPGLLQAKGTIIKTTLAGGDNAHDSGT